MFNSRFLVHKSHSYSRLVVRKIPLPLSREENGNGPEMAGASQEGWRFECCKGQGSETPVAGFKDTKAWRARKGPEASSQRK